MMLHKPIYFVQKHADFCPIPFQKSVWQKELIPCPQPSKSTCCCIHVLINDQLLNNNWKILIISEIKVTVNCHEKSIHISIYREFNIHHHIFYLFRYLFSVIFSLTWHSLASVAVTDFCSRRWAQVFNRKKSVIHAPSSQGWEHWLDVIN